MGDAEFLPLINRKVSVFDGQRQDRQTCGINTPLSLFVSITCFPVAERLLVRDQIVKENCLRSFPVGTTKFIATDGVVISPVEIPLLIKAKGLPLQELDSPFHLLVFRVIAHLQA